jgi:hypothetical protein
LKDTTNHTTLLPKHYIPSSFFLFYPQSNLKQFYNNYKLGERQTILGKKKIAAALEIIFRLWLGLCKFFFHFLLFLAGLTALQDFSWFQTQLNKYHSREVSYSKDSLNFSFFNLENEVERR